MRSLLKDTSVAALAAAGSLSLLIACGADEKKPAATAAAPPPDTSARAAGAHASGPPPVVTTQPAPNAPSPPPVTVEEDVRTRCVLPDHRDAGLPFDYNGAELSDSDQEMLSALATCLGQGGGLAGESIRIVGHTDARGSDEYNMELGMRRAVAVREYLFGKGVPAGSVVLKSEGEREASGADEEGRALDRRVEIEIVSPERAPAAPAESPEEIPPAPENP